MIYGYYDSESFCLYLKKRGVSIGNNVHFYSPHHCNIDLTRPFGISIGNNVHITKNVTLLTHGFDWCVLKDVYNDVLGSFGNIEIGNNVFIGNGATILKGVKIGDNVIIGASSLVTKNCLKSGVYVGVPAKFVCSLEDYYKKRINSQIAEATCLVKTFYNKYHKYPSKAYLDEFFFLFEDRSEPLISEYKYQMMNNGKYSECELLFLNNHRKVFSSYEDFLSSIEESKNE